MTTASIERVSGSSRDPFTVKHAQGVWTTRLRLVPNKPQASSVLEGSSLSAPAWIDAVVRQIERSASGRDVSVAALTRCLMWVLALPGEVKAPRASVGDDESVSLEWEAGGSILHILFDDRMDEWYFEDPDGNEIESRLGSSSDKLIQALQASAR